jgi:tetratricopeptide (TPR) repeat protein
LTLRLNLQSDPRATAHHDAVRRAIPLRDDRIDFYEELVSTSPSENYHSLSLARAYRAAGQNSDAVSHYQRYLRSAMDAEAFEELAEVYHAVGQAYLSSSSRQIAQSIRCKGVNECLSS